LPREACLLPQRLPFGITSGSREQRLGPQALCEVGGRLTPELDPFGRALEPVERPGRAFPAAGRAGKLVLDTVSLGEQCLHAFVDPLPLERRCSGALLDL